jgi:hypothetical protein
MEIHEIDACVTLQQLCEVFILQNLKKQLNWSPVNIRNGDWQAPGCVQWRSAFTAMLALDAKLFINRKLKHFLEIFSPLAKIWSGKLIQSHHPIEC